MTFIALVLRAGLLWPAAPVVDVVAASWHAVNVETVDVPAAALIAIAQHESDLKPNAVSWIGPRGRVDRLWRGERLPRHVVCGYLQHMATGDACAASISRGSTMADGAIELAAWVRPCRGDLRCIFRGHAGGWGCAVRNLCSANARAFADLFYRNARRLAGDQETYGDHRSGHRS